MGYKEEEKDYCISLLGDLIDDPGQGIYRGKPRDFVLQDSSLNLMEEIRDDAIDYFKRNNISWHHGANGLPSGHMLSSQVACINYLFYLRNRKDLMDLVLKGLRDDITEAVLIDDAYIEFEFIGKTNYLGEKHFNKGANSTSIDAAILGKKNNNKNIIIFIEWKYTETYSVQDKYIDPRPDTYDKLIIDPNSPFKVEDPRYLYFDPFDQLMRQTLLAWKITENNDYNADEYMHILVIPKENTKLRTKVTSPYLKGDNIENAWKSTLKNPETFNILSPKELLAPLLENKDIESYINYLETRYKFKK